MYVGALDFFYSVPCVFVCVGVGVGVCTCWMEILVHSITLVLCLILGLCSIDSELACHSPPPLSPAVSTMSTDTFSLSRGTPSSVGTSDFGHSLMAGLGDHYLPDFVLHGTSQPASEFRSKLVSDLAAFVKVSSTSSSCVLVLSAVDDVCDVIQNYVHALMWFVVIFIIHIFLTPTCMAF